MLQSQIQIQKIHKIQNARLKSLRKITDLKALNQNLSDFNYI